MTIKRTSILLTEELHSKITNLAKNDRRSFCSMVSNILEDHVKLLEENELQQSAIPASPTTPYFLP